MITNLLRFLDRRNRLLAGILVVLMLLNSLAEAISLGLVMHVLTVLADPNGVQDNAYLSAVYDFVGASDNGSFLIFMVGALVAFLFAKNIFIGFLQFRIFSFVWDNVARMSRIFVRGYLRQPYTFHLSTNTAYILKNVTFCIPNLFYGIGMNAFQIATEVMVVTGIITILALASPMSAFGALAGVGLVMVLIYVALKARITRWGVRVNQSDGAILDTLEQTLSGIKEIKVQEREDYFHGRFDRVVTENTTARKHYSTVIQMPRLILEVVLVGGLLTALAVFVQSGASLATMIPILGLYGMAAMRLLPSFSRISTNLNNLDFNRAAMGDLVKDLNAFMATEKELASRPEAGDVVSFNKSLDMDEVSFSYSGREEAALNHLKLSVAKGEWVAIVGPSGAGKTTVANILLGLFRFDEGQILVDGIPVDTDSRAWRNRVGFIPQDIFVLHDTFRCNITFGEPDSEFDQEVFTTCIQAAQLEAVVEALPNGMDTVIGADGISLSGGEAQRMAIARALYHGADILIMDEPTSALDSETEKAIVDSIARIAGEKTIITIAHRLNMIRHCDRIFLLEDGQVTADGSFKELETGNNTFKRMVAIMNASDQP